MLLIKRSLIIVICKGVSLLLLIGLCLSNSHAQTAEAGEAIFKKPGFCSTCHTIGKGRLVGPDLADVHKKRSEDWIIKFVTSSQTMIKDGDEEAVKIFEEYNNVPMPDQALSPAEIKDVLAYIISQSPEEEAADETEIVAEPAPVQEESLAGNSLNGQHLFSGLMRLKNKGPTCNSCHSVTNDAVMSGGVLAKDLTEAYSRLSAAGIKAILSNPPFPKMAQAYKNKTLTDQEVEDLTAFLKETDEQRIYQHERDYGKLLLWGGVPSAAILLLAFYLFWINRKRKPVNHRVFDRQF